MLLCPDYNRPDSGCLFMVPRWPGAAARRESKAMIYVDPLADHGWILRGIKTENCHMFTDDLDTVLLHKMARDIGMKPSWFQISNSGDPHYDLVKRRREAAIALGAIEVSFDEAVKIWRARREKLKFIPRKANNL